MALVLGNLVAFIKADDTQFEKSLRQAKQDFEGFGDKVKAGAAIVGAAIGAALAAGVAGAMELDAAKAKLTAQIGDPALAAQLGKVAGAVYSRGFGESAAENMSAVQAVISSHLADINDAGAVEAMTVQVQAYATAWGSDVAEAAKYVSSLLGSGLAKNATHALDLITVASRKVPAALREDLLEAGNEYGQFFASLGFSGEQAFGLLVEASEKGTYGIDKAGDAVKEFTLLATDMSKSTTDAYKSIGLDAGKMSNALLKGGPTAQKAFQQIVKGLLSIKDPTTQANTALAFFGTPLEDLNKSDIPEFLRNMTAAGNGLGNVAGEAKKAGDALEQSASQKLEAFKRSAQQALVEKLSEALPVLIAVGGWIERNSEFVGSLALVLGTIAGIIGIVTLATKAWAAAQVALNIAMMLNPIGLIILIVIGLIAVFVGLWMRFEGFRNFWKATWDFILAVFQTWWSVFSGFWTGVWDFTLAVAQAWWSVFSAFWSMIGGFFGGLLSGWYRLFTGTWSMIFDGIASAYGWVVGKVSAFVDFVGSLPGKIAAKTRGLWDGIKESFRSALNWMIGKWNNFSLTLGGGSVLGMGIPSVTLNTPNIPYMADGGDIMRAGAAVVGEAGPELINLPRGASVRPLSGVGGGAGGLWGTLRLILQWPDGRVIRDQIVDAASVRGQTPGRFLSIDPT